MRIAAATAMLCAAGVVAPGAASPARKPPPQLQLVRTQPFTVSGLRFIRASASASSSTGTSSRTGRRRRPGCSPQRLRAVAFDRCSMPVVYAVGFTGDRAVLGKLPQPACPPAS